MLGGAPTTEDSTEHEVYFKSQRKKKNNGNGNSNSRRFSDDQIKSLESLFKMENKLEPRKKLEMARELGLHPRQVAIWFQNRRARWKSKQVEQDYSTLKADYDTLSDRFESLKKEKHALLQQLRNLCSQLKGGNVKELDSGSENASGEQDMAAVYSDGDNAVNTNQKEKVKMGDYNVSWEETDETKVSNFDLGSLFDQRSDNCSNWWEYWSSN